MGVTVSAFGSSMQYTIGTALERAREQGHRVEILAEGHWLDGHVVASDGIGVVLDNGAEDHAIVRLECVAAVRVRTAAPMLRPAPYRPQPAAEQRTADGAMPMPAPRRADD